MNRPLSTRLSAPCVRATEPSAGFDEHLLARGHSRLEARTVTASEPPNAAAASSKETCLGRRVPRALARRLVDVVLPPTTGVGLRPPAAANSSRSLGRRLGPVSLGGCRDEHRRFSFPIVLRQDAAVSRQKIVLQVSRQRLRLVQQNLVESTSLSKVHVFWILYSPKVRGSWRQRYLISTRRTLDEQV